MDTKTVPGLGYGQKRKVETVDFYSGEVKKMNYYDARLILFNQVFGIMSKDSIYNWGIGFQEMPAKQKRQLLLYQQLLEFRFLYLRQQQKEAA